MIDETRRKLLRSGLLLAVSPALLTVAACRHRSNPVLQPADSNGIRLPAGFSSRVIARSGQPVNAGSAFRWHDAPDGGECISDPEHAGGWIYLNNSEIDAGGGGASALRFDAAGNVIDAYAILSGTSRNCAGGLTPWGTWLSCEETDTGLVWECDPLGVRPAVARPGLGRFMHEAVAADPVNRHLYLTEDKPDGGLYRFTPQNRGDLSSGVLEVAITRDTTSHGIGIDWQPVPDASATGSPTRYQVQTMALFNGGEGVVYFDDKIYFTTKGDNSVWRLDIASSVVSRIYHAADYEEPVLTGVDNITADSSGNLFVAEDGGDMQVVMLSASTTVAPIAQLPGHAGSEITGVAFSPDGSRLYFSSQRGKEGRSADGMTFEIMGPFGTL